ncbi:carbohydrate ABC transporter permease [Treponema sp. HNW]|uniref:carbohydrate ABC transporter permease n=1 Tax=Treponema sp. HNW TaxID=3116654 RepID=UPI003D0A9A45
MDHQSKKVFLHTGKIIVLGLYLAFVLFPIYWMVITSFKYNTEIINAQRLTYFPEKFTPENYNQLFSMYDYGNMLKNSLIISLSAGFCVTMLSIFGGYGLARYKFDTKTLFLLFFLVTQMIPGILVIIPLYIIFSKMNIVNTRLSLFIFYLISNLPFCVITMRSFFERIPYTLEEAATVDGCTKLQTLRKIVLPVMFPGIVAVFVFAFIGAWNELIAGTIFINTPNFWTIPIGLKSLIGKYDVKWGVLMAGGVLALLPTAIMFAVMQRFVVAGLTAGAVKE